MAETALGDSLLEHNHAVRIPVGSATDFLVAVVTRIKDRLAKGASLER